MQITNYQRYDNDGIELVINTQTGEGFATISGYARMAGKAKSTISERFGKLDLEEAETLTATGLKKVRLVNEDLITQWLPKDCPESASQLLKLGVRVFLHKLAGFEVQSTAVTPSFDPSSLTRLDILKLAIAAEEELQIELAKNKVLTEQLEEQAPLVKLAETLTIQDKDAVNVGELAKAYQIGRTTFFEILREVGFIMQAPSRLPYQRHINANRAEVYRKERAGQPGVFDSVTMITAKGQEYLAGKLLERQRALTTEVQMEALLDFASNAPVRMLNSTYSN